jgi:hypothetical protein
VALDGNGALHFSQMPSGIRAGLSATDLVILNGDANYRRLIEDRRWEPWDSMEEAQEAVGCFPAAFACLRTLKSELVVDGQRRSCPARHSPPTHQGDAREGSGAADALQRVAHEVRREPEGERSVRPCPG